MTTGAARQGWTIYGPPVRGRSCGTCKVCCTQVPVELPDGLKPANARCRHLCSKGCRIYARRPAPCRIWSCRWLFDDATAGLRRPDQSGVVIDAMLDTILADGQPVEVVQLWCDPNRRDAHRDPGLRAYLTDVGERTGMISIVRWSSEDAIFLVPPGLNKEGEWLELGASMHSQQDMQARLAAAGASHISKAADTHIEATASSDGG